MEPTEFKAAKAIGMSEGSIRYAKKNGKNFLKNQNSEAFLYSGVKCFVYKMSHSNFNWMKGDGFG